MGPGLQLQKVVRPRKWFITLQRTFMPCNVPLYLATYLYTLLLSSALVRSFTSSFCPLHSTSHSLLLRLRYAALSTLYIYSPFGRTVVL
jgi:hypothetical protein